MKPDNLILVAYIATITGCGSGSALEPRFPEPPPQGSLAVFEVRPRSIAISPGMTVPLSIKATDSLGKALTWKVEAITYVSNNPAVATVTTHGGVIKAVSRGTAEIAVTITLNGITERRRIPTEVMELRPGLYQLSAPISQSAWGMEGGTSGALLTLEQGPWSNSGTPAGRIGTFTNLRFVTPNGIIGSESSGIVTSSVGSRGRLMLRFLDGQSVPWEGTIESIREQELAGYFSVGDGFAAGNFSAKRIED